MFGGGEIIEILNESLFYPNLSNVTWLNIDAYRYPSMEIWLESIQVKILSPHPVLVQNEKVKLIGDEFKAKFGKELVFNEACVYDSCMVIGFSVIEADSINSSIVKEVLPSVAEDFSGITGKCSLDKNGDRLDFQMGLFTLDYEPVFEWLLIGRYYSTNDTIVWK